MPRLGRVANSVRRRARSEFTAQALNKQVRTSTPLEDPRNLGPVCAPELRHAGIESLEQLRELGWEEAYVRWVELFPERINVNAAVAMIGAEQGIDWRKVSSADRNRAKKIVASLRRAKR